MKKVYIYQQAKSAMQSGKKNSDFWLVVPVCDEQQRWPDAIMSWVSCQGTESQNRYRFTSQEMAVKFAQNSGFDYQIITKKNKKITPKSYASNFTQ